jgi:FKBP-type peptidyl-prolyl cis-trans isomerase
LEVHSDSAPSAIELLIQLSQLKETTELHPLLNWIFKKIAEMNNGKLKEATESSRDSARAKVDEQNAAEERKRKMMEAKARAMAQMQKKQSAFIQTHKSEIDESAMLKSSGTVATDVADVRFYSSVYELTISGY